MSNENKIIKGFTLAEVLITLLVIGIVASLTVPALINDIQNKDLSVENSTLRGVLMRAHQQIKAENGGTINGLNYGVEMSKKLNLTRNCIANPQTNGCWHAPGVAKIVERDGSFKPFTSSYSTGMVLQNGIMLLLGSGVVNCSDRSTTNANTMACYKGTHYYSGYCTNFQADMNGRRGPNVYGQDIREVNIYDSGVFMYGDRMPPRWLAERNYDTYSSDDWQAGGTCYDNNVYTHTNY